MKIDLVELSHKRPGHSFIRYLLDCMNTKRDERV